MTQNYTSVASLVKKSKTYIIPPTSNFGGKHKEAEPLPRPVDKYEIKEVVEHQPDEEIKPFIQTRTENIEIPSDLKNIGVQSTSTTHFPSHQNVKLPISDDKIISGLHQPITSSIRWLATFALYLLQQAHLNLKVIHGKIVRVVKI